MPGKSKPMPAQSRKPAMSGMKPLPPKAAPKATEMRGYGRKK